MSAIALSITDTSTMLRRTLTHMSRNRMMIILTTMGTPVILLLMFYNLFGGVMQGNDANGLSYLNYVTPGILMITVIYSTGIAAMRVNSDMTQGIVTRFRSMSISGGAVLNGHVIGSALGSLISIAVIFVLAYLMGFRSTAGLSEWLAAIGLIVLYVGAVMWLATAIGVWSKSPEAVNGVLFLFYILPFFSSAFVPTTSMTPVFAWIAEHQPFTPIIDTIRALLLGLPAGDKLPLALAWCVGIGFVSYVWARVAYHRAGR